MGWSTARCLNESTYAFKVRVEDRTGRILGAHLIGPDAAEVINLFALAMRNGLTAATLRNTTFCYPTATSDIEYRQP